MTLRLVLQSSSPASVSPYRLLDDQDRELTWANSFLDAQRIRQLSLRSLRAYAYDLLHLARWQQHTRHSLPHLTESLLIDYVRSQLEHEPKPAASTINHRLGVLRCLYRMATSLLTGLRRGNPFARRRLQIRLALGYWSVGATRSAKVLRLFA